MKLHLDADLSNYKVLQRYDYGENLRTNLVLDFILCFNDFFRLSMTGGTAKTCRNQSLIV